ncbi:unnamed protein product [Sphacelaria rigidula]
MPLNKRTTQHRLAEALGIPRSTLSDNLKALGVRAHSSALKPLLTDEGKLGRLRWELRRVDTTTSSSRVVHHLEHFVHVNDKRSSLQGRSEIIVVRRRNPFCPQDPEEHIYPAGYASRCCSPASKKCRRQRQHRLLGLPREGFSYTQQP